MLGALRRGNSDAMDLLFSAVYDELHRIAHRRLNRLSPGSTLNTTALVHEAYLKLVDHAGDDNYYSRFFIPAMTQP